MNDRSSSINTPFVSVIIPCYKQAHFLEKAVKSVLEQTHSNLECLIVDDGSPDNTRQVSEDLMSRDNRVKYLYKENGGSASACNFGVKHAVGEWIQLLDSDDWLHKDKIRFQLSYANKKESDNVVLYSEMEAVFEDDEQYILKFLGPMKRDQLIDRVLIPWCIQSACLLINKSIFKETTYDEIRFRKAMQDVKFMLDLLMNNITFIYTPIVGAFYRRHSSNVTGSDFSSPLIKDTAIKLLSTAQKDYFDLREISKPRVADHLMEAIEDKNKDRFEKLIKLVKLPITLYGIKFQNEFQIRLCYSVRLILPLVRTILAPYRKSRWIKRKPFLAEVLLAKTSESYTVEEIQSVLNWLTSCSGDCPVQGFSEVTRY
ncbi:MAG: glycosyltransferase family 2 protein [Leptolyngbyaceae cyanobacterium MO_188.B28]|nr:glycosyltransferase family 2 protein [Leptolyngbyaceae cyanobacterium MO_188.B28]